MNEEASSERRAIRLALGLIAVLAAIARFRPVADPDVPWHLLCGQQSLKSGALALPDESSFTAAGKVFYGVEWLADLVIYEVWRLFGYAGLTLFSAAGAFLSTLAVGGLALKVAGSRPRLGLAVTALAAAAASFRFEPRPQIFKLILLPLGILFALDFAAASAAPAVRRRAALLLIAIELLWSQVHGSFILLPALVGLALLNEAPRLGLRGFAARLWIVPALALSLILVPGHFDLVHLVHTLTSGDATHYIQEMRRLDLGELYPRGIGPFLWLDLIFLIGAVRSWRSRRLRIDDFGFVLLGLALVLGARRFRGVWAILSVPFAARADAEPEALPSPSRLERSLSLLAVALVLPIQIWSVEKSDPVRGYALGIERDTYPIDAAGALARAGVEGNVLNEYEDGGYLELMLSPKVKIAIDGRTPTLFDEELFFRVRRAMVDGGEPFRRFVETYGANLVLLKKGRPLCRELASSSAWYAAYLDDDRALFAKRDAGHPLSPLRAIDPCAPEASIDRRCKTDRGVLEADVESLLRLAPQAPYALRLAAEIEIACPKDPRRAVELAEGALSSGTRRPRAFETLARAAATAKDRPRALEAIDLALAHGGDDTMRGERGRIELESGMIEAAERDLERVSKALDDATPIEVRLAHARALLLLGNKERARIQAERALWQGAGAAAQDVLRSITATSTRAGVH